MRYVSGFRCPRFIINASKFSMKRSFFEFSTNTNTMASPKLYPLARDKLTSKELQLQNLLLDLVKNIDSTKTIGANIQLRFAGGWVRDKLLGISSNDIDIAINCMTGEAFGLELEKFCQQDLIMEKYGIKKEDVHGLHTIRLNPEKSKNLETATMRLFGVDLDFVNLRKETYAQDSRNPQIEFGTAQEDALRRDATINALFYNIHTNNIEDFADGVEDLKAKLIKTPLDPFQTFMDDPLRVLRLVRFASRLDFRIHDEARQCMQNRKVLEALSLKITRERVGIELDKMLKGEDPRAALILIHELNLYHVIFTDVNRPSLDKPELRNWPSVFNLLHDISQNKSMNSLYRCAINSDAEHYLVWVLACMAPWETVPEPVQDGPKKKATSAPLAVSIAREGFRATNKVCDILLGAHRNLSEILRYKKAILEGNCWVYKRGKVAMMLRRWEGNSMHWRLQIFYAMFVEALEISPKEPEKLKALRKTWEDVFISIKNHDLINVHLEKGLVDGRNLVKALNIKPGPWMKSALEVCLEWQFDHPGLSDTTQAIKQVQKWIDYHRS